MISNCLLASSESGSTEILHDLMSLISEFPKDDQEYILKAYPLVLKIAENKGHTDFIKELTSYFCKIVPDDRSFFEQAKTDAIMRAKSLYDAPKNQEEVLKTLGALEYTFRKKDIRLDITEGHSEISLEPVLSIREALEIPIPSYLPNSQESTVDQIGDLEGSPMYVC